MRTVFKANEIAHVWTTGKYPIGRCGNIHFEGDACYSYRTVIANRIRSKNKTAYVFDRHTFSSRTSMHQGKISRALRHHEDALFNVSIGQRGQDLKFTPVTLRDHYILEFQTQLAASRERKFAHHRAEDLITACGQLARAYEVAEYFGVSHSRIVKLQTKIEVERQQAIVVAAARIELERIRRLAKMQAEIKQAKSDAVDAAKQILLGRDDWEELINKVNRRYSDVGIDDLLEEQPELRTALNAYIEQKEAEATAAWIAGKGSSYFHRASNTNLLRQEEFEMVVSNGARVPMQEAVRLFKFLNRLEGRDWRRNGETYDVGPFELRSVTKTGVQAGCTFVNWTEIHRFTSTPGFQQLLQEIESSKNDAKNTETDS